MAISPSERVLLRPKKMELKNRQWLEAQCVKAWTSCVCFAGTLWFCWNLMNTEILDLTCGL